MQVYKAFFKVLNQNKKPMIMYLVIFSIVLFCFVIPNLTGEKEGYVEKSCDFAVFDYDKSVASEKLIEYLSKNNKIIEIKDDTRETIQDELYYRTIKCAVRIPEGFEEQLKEGELEELLEIVTISGTTAASLFERNVDNYLNSVESYVAAGYTVDEATDLAIEALDVSVDVSLPNNGDASMHSPKYYYYNYLAWIMIYVMILGVAPILLRFNEKEIKNRIKCSSYHFVNLNKELLLGVLSTGIIVCAIFSLMSLLCFQKEMLNISGALFVLNLVCYMLVALAIAYTVSTFVEKFDMLNMASNIISIGMSFLCGVFVPREFIGEGVQRAAHFLPAYWYCDNAIRIDTYTSSELTPIFTNMGVQILFAFAIVTVGLVIARNKKSR